MPGGNTGKEPGQAEAQKAIKEKLKEDGLGMLGTVPYGQSDEKLEKADRERAARYWTTIERSGKWPQWLMSFEVWCGMTMYDRNAPRGGEPFQRLMGLLLGHSVMAKSKPHPNAFKQSLTYDTDSKTYGPAFKAGTPTMDWYKALNSKGDLMSVFENGKLQVSGAHIGASARPNVDSNGKQAKFGLPLDNKSNQGHKLLQVGGGSFEIGSNGYGVFSKHDWLLKCNVRVGTFGADSGHASQSNGQSFVTKGIETTGNAHCWETSKTAGDVPCMPVANCISVLYGLYYYPDSEHADYNWNVYERVGGDVFEIRFRCPNPAYGPEKWYSTPSGMALEGDYLHVIEPNNPLNSKFLASWWKNELAVRNKGRRPTSDGYEPKRPPFTTLGGTYPNDYEDKKLVSGTRNRLHVPKMTRGNENVGPTKEHKLVSPWLWLLHGEEDRFIFGPFWAEQKRWYQVDHTVRFEVGKLISEVCRAPDGSSVAMPLTNAVTTGFRMSQGQLLYPHYDSGANILRSNPRGTTPRRVGYMTDVQKSSTFDGVEPSRGLAKHVLNWEDIKDLSESELRLYLLQDKEVPTAPRVTVAATQQPNRLSVEATDVEEDSRQEFGDDTNRDADLGPDGAVSTSNDALTEQDLAAVRNDRIQMEGTYGMPGAGLSDTLNAELDEDFTEQDVKNNRSDAVKTAVKEAGLDRETLQEGATRRDKNEKQCHWRSALHQPCSHSDCYETPAIKYRTELMDQAAIDAYKQKYGSDTNLYLSDENSVKKIIGVDVTWGVRKHAVMRQKLNADPLRLAEILCIFFDDNGIGHWDIEQKRKGMKEGVFCVRGRDQKPQPGKADRRHKNTELLWPPVCTNPYSLPPRLQECLREYICERADSTDHTELEDCLKRANRQWKQKFAALNTPMTVEEWVTTPWHYETLPYTRHYAVFRDGECWSEGCNRCSRSFFEYKYMMYADRNSAAKTQGYPNALWERRSGYYAPSACRVAALPLHDPMFWSDTKDRQKRPTWDGATPVGPGPSQLQERSDVERDPAVPRETDQGYVGGTMDWPHYQLERRRLSGKDKQRKVVKGRDNMTFRRYLNLAYDDDATYAGVPQGRMRQRGKVLFGDGDYRVTRSHKYGNVCNDCCQVLDMAPGLFVRNNRWLIDAGIVMKNEQAVRDTRYNYWQSLQQQTGADIDALLYFARYSKETTDPLMRRQKVAQFHRAASGAPPYG